MRPWFDWSASISLAATCMLFAGCGGGETNEPAADQPAAANPAADTGEPPAPAPAAAGRVGPGLARRGPGAAAPKADAADKNDPAQAASEAAPSAKSDVGGGSTTAEMLALATGGQSASAGSQSSGGGSPAPAQASGGGPGTPSGASGAPGQSGGQSSYGEQMRNQQQQQAGQASGGMSGYANAMRNQQQGGQGAGGMSGYANAMRGQQQAGNSSGPGGAAGAPGGNGQAGYPGGLGRGGAMGAEANDGPGDVHTPQGAVKAFLSALQAKDRDRLAEATALHSQVDAGTEKNKELFGKIVDMSISDAELDDLAKKLHGYRIGGENAVKSTGRLGVYIDKRTEEGSTLRLTLTVRKEKKGWGVMDMTNHPTEFKPMGNMNRRKAAGGS